MPYKFKGKRDCKQSDGSKGKYLTVKKDGSRRCYKSEKQYKAAQAWAHEADEIGEDHRMGRADIAMAGYENPGGFGVFSNVKENQLRRFIRLILAQDKS